MPNLNRRSILLALVLTAMCAVDFAYAKDGDSGGGSGNSGSGSNNSGSGNSGSGGGDHDDNDNDDDDDDKDDDNSGRSNDDHERARRAVERGEAVTLKKLKVHLATNYPGKVLNVSLRRASGVYFYNVRILANGNRVKLLSLNALTLQPRGK